MLLWSVDMNHFKGVHGGRETAQFAEFAVRNIPLHPLDTHTHNHSPSWLPQSQSGPRTTLTPWKIPLRMIRGRFCLGAKLTLRREYKETAEQTAHSTAVEKRGREMCNVVHVLAKND